MPSLPWVNAIKARVEKATPGPWEVHDYNRDNPERDDWFGVIRGAFEIGDGLEVTQIGRVKYSALGHDANLGNATLIAHAREDVPRLLRAVEVLGEAVETACGIIEVGDQRLLAGDGPVGALPPDITLAEWRKMYRALDAARRSAAKGDPR